MTVQELHKNFKVQMDKNAESVAFGGCPAFLPEEIDLFLNQAYIEVISNKFTGNNVIQKSFEEGTKRVSDLQNLIKTDKEVAATRGEANTISISNFSEGTNTRLFFVDCILHFDDQITPCILIEHANTREFLQKYNNTPWIPVPVAVLEDDTLKIYFDPIEMEATNYTVDITYIKYPEVIDNTQPTKEINEVPDNVLYEVIGKATMLALENVESARTQSKIQLTSLAE